MELMQASRQWSTRPSDERFVSLHELGAKLTHDRQISAEKVVASRDLTWQPDTFNDPIKGLLVAGKQGATTAPTNWAFKQACALAKAPAGYLASLPAPMAADCLNYGFKHARDVQDTKALLRVNGERSLAALTGPNYGRVWNHEIVDTLIEKFGDGVTGHWRVPGEFGERVEITKDNTTIYAGDRDMFVFLADEDRRMKVDNRRDGKSGSMARGFFVWNSEVGSSTFGIAAFLFDYVCCNRIVWGAQDFRQIKVRHTVSAPHRLVEEVLPAIRKLDEASASPVEATIKAAQERKIDDLHEFLAARRFTTAEITGAATAFQEDEGRPLSYAAANKTGEETSVWDVVTGLTAHARSIKWQDERVALETKAGKLLDLVAVR